MTEPTAPPSAPAGRASAVSPGALTRYRVMAIITGTLLIVVFLGMLRYPLEWWTGFEEISGLEQALSILAQVHGFIYVVYLATVLQLWMQARWGYGRLATLFLGGVVPVLSFVIEKRVTREVRTGREA